MPKVGAPPGSRRLENREGGAGSKNSFQSHPRWVGTTRRALFSLRPKKATLRSFVICQIIFKSHLGNEVDDALVMAERNLRGTRLDSSDHLATTAAGRRKGTAPTEEDPWKRLISFTPSVARSPRCCTGK